MSVGCTVRLRSAVMWSFVLEESVSEAKLVVAIPRLDLLTRDVLRQRAGWSYEFAMTSDPARRCRQ